MKRVALSPSPEESTEIKSHMNTVYVYLKNEESQTPPMTLKHPKFQAEHLVGQAEGREVKISLDSIDYIEALRIDGKKVAIGSAILVVLILIAYLYTAPLRVLAED